MGIKGGTQTQAHPDTHPCLIETHNHLSNLVRVGFHQRQCIASRGAIALGCWQAERVVVDGGVDGRAKLTQAREGGEASARVTISRIHKSCLTLSHARIAM